MPTVFLLHTTKDDENLNLATILLLVLKHEWSGCTVYTDSMPTLETYAGLVQFTCPYDGRA